MQKWEYLVLQVIILRGFGKSTINIGSDNKEVEKAVKGKSISEAFNYVGSLGWELVTTTPGSATASSHLYFKRLYSVLNRQAGAAPTNGSATSNGVKRQ